MDESENPQFVWYIAAQVVLCVFVKRQSVLQASMASPTSPYELCAFFFSYVCEVSLSTFGKRNSHFTCISTISTFLMILCSYLNEYLPLRSIIVVSVGESYF